MDNRRNMEKFNQTLQEFLKVIETNYPNQTESIRAHYTFENKETQQYAQEFLQQCQGQGKDLAYQNEILFSKDSIVLKHVNFHEIWNDESLTDAQRDNIWKYLHAIYLFAVEAVEGQSFRSLLRQWKTVNESNQTEQMRTFLTIVDFMKDKPLPKKPESDDDDEDEVEDDEGSGLFNIPELIDGPIGSLAREIAAEFKPEDIKLDNPAELLQNLMSGNFNEDDDKSGLVSMMKRIAAKIQDKVSSGDFQESTLIEEAQKIMKSFGDIQDKPGKGKKGKKNAKKSAIQKMFATMMSNVMNKMKSEMSESETAQMNEMMSQMGISPNAAPDQMPNIDQLLQAMGGSKENLSEPDRQLYEESMKAITQGAKSGVNPAKLRSHMDLKSTRDRLRRKLEEKKKAAASSTVVTTKKK